MLPFFPLYLFIYFFAVLPDSETRWCRGWLWVILGGLFQKVKTLDEGIFVLASAIARYYLLNGGRLFLESRQINTKEELREGLDDWLSTRSRGNYFKPFGSSEGPKTERYEWNDRFPRDGARGDS